MDAFTSSRLALPTALGCVLLLVLVVPAVRSRLRHGHWGVVLHRRADPFQGLVGGVLGACIAAVAAGAGLYTAFGPDVIGVWASPAWMSRVGWGLVASGVVVIAIAQAQMGASWRVGIDDRPTDLVTSGLYRFARNPIYSGAMAALAGAVLLVPCSASVALLVLTLVVIAFQSRLEEIHLLALHGDAYRAYASRVGRFWPWVGCFRT